MASVNSWFHLLEILFSSLQLNLFDITQRRAQKDAKHKKLTGQRGTVGNVSGNIRESDCRSSSSSIPAGSYTFVEIDHEIISTVIILPSAESFKKGCCQLQVKVCARSTGEMLVQACPGKCDHSC